MTDSAKHMDMDAQERKIKEQAEDINPSENTSPDSLAEATTAPLDDDALGGTATQDDVKK
ncbi:hypothetical protein FHS24_001038 [Psychrobacter luti]|uniref:Uncharacterized protein n=1 Tax=Psychrobacter luti TaxID=198481 RepID=A0A839TAV8_9GAMM|nr:hypothetical protein [Psychrobacter luti]MBB3106537.1 hypothetical protein [Psychrobacter luti]